MDAPDITTPATWRVRVGTGLILGLVGALWLVLFHDLAGTAGRSPALLTHWLVLAMIAVPATCVASIVSGAAARRVTRDGRIASLRAAYVTLAAASSALLMGLVAPLDRWMFNAAPAHPAQPMNGLDTISRETLVALAFLLPVALVITSRSFRAARIGLPSWAIPSARNAAFGGVAIALGAGLVLAPSGINPLGRATAADTVANPCPNGAALKHFDVSAIDVDITLNRFGDHDPKGHMYVLNDAIPAVRAAEQTHYVSVGEHDGDPIQPLVIRANMGDCVEVSFTNKLASGQPVGMHIDGLAYRADSSGDAVGRNPDTNTAPGATRTYMYYVPKIASVEGARYMHPGPANRALVNHGLFGTLMVEPEGSVYLNPTTRAPLASGWEAIVVPGQGKSFREAATILHEIGDEKERVLDKTGHELPFIDPHTTTYRPGTRAINYRSEPFYNRLQRTADQKSLGYSSYTFADPATTIPRGYLGDPTKIRLLHAGSEVFHIYHLHGGGIRWRLNPHGDPSYNYADTGLNKTPSVVHSNSNRLDAQSVGPGESYDLEIEGGAGGVQQAAGDFVWHCHIGEHYVAGMWSLWRAYDTLQPDLAPLPDRAEPPMAVDSRGLIGKTINGQNITKDNLDQWIRPQLPPQGTSFGPQDATVLDWSIKNTPDGPLYLNEPEDTTAPWVDNFNENAAHPSALRNDVFEGDRPVLQFNPINGRPAWPMLRTHVGKRPPFSGQGHSGAPWLGETVDKPAAPGTIDPYANRKDGLCPTAAPIRKFNIVAIETPIQVTKTQVDPIGRIMVLAKEKAATYANQRPKEPIAIRANIGDCAAVTFTSELKDGSITNFDKVNIHIHHVQFDPQASDGVITGYSYEQSIRPYKIEDPQLVDAAAAGSASLHLVSVAKFHKGVYIAVGQGLESIEVHKIVGIDAATNTLTLDEGLSADHQAGEYAGVEFERYRWYPDVALDNIFFHDHVDGIHNWGHGLVGQFIIEPKGSTYHDPTTGAQVDSGTIVDIHTQATSDEKTKLVPGVVDGSYREFVIWPLDENPVTDSTINLHAEPWADRQSGGDPSLRFSSYRWGDPATPLPKAYPGDSFVVRSIAVDANEDTLHFDGHRAVQETRARDAQNRRIGTPQDTWHMAVSDRNTLILEGGAGGPNHVAGDYLYSNGLGRRFRQGAWGILRVLPGQSADLQPLPDHAAPPSTGPEPTQTGGRPPASTDPGTPCPTGAPVHSFDVTALDLPLAAEFGHGSHVTTVFIPTVNETAVTSGQLRPEPLVLHVAEGECVEVNLTNHRLTDRVSFDVSKLVHDRGSSGINVGYNPEQTIAPGTSRTYRYFADTERLGGSLISDFGGDDTGTIGLYGAMVTSPKGATFTDPVTGVATDIGAKVDVHVPGGTAHRDFTLLYSDDDPQIGASFMPYPTVVSGPATVNYETAPRPDDATGFSSLVHGDPVTPLLQAYAGDPVVVHAIGAPGSEQVQTFTLGGMSFPAEPHVPGSLQLTHVAVGPTESFDAHVTGGAGGEAKNVGDYAYGTGRLVFMQAGMWGLFRSMSDASCPIKPLDGGTCLGVPGPTGGGTTPGPLPSPNPNPGSSPNSGPGGGSTTGTPAPKPLRITTRLAKSNTRQASRNGFTVTVANPNHQRVTLDSLRVCLPNGFTFVPKSVTGDLRSAPTSGRCGRARAAVQLTWRLVTVPPAGLLRFRFSVRAGRNLGTLSASVTGSAGGGFSVTPTTTRIRVMALESH